MHIRPFLVSESVVIIFIVLCCHCSHTRRCYQTEKISCNLKYIHKPQLPQMVTISKYAIILSVHRPFHQLY